MKAVFFIPVLLLLFAGCSDMYMRVQELRSAKKRYETMVFVPGRSVTAGIGKGAFENASAETPVTVESFYIGQYEVTYGLWYDVYKWATEDADGNGRRDSDGGTVYAFLNPGRSGTDGIMKEGDGVTGSDGGIPDDVSGRQPVTSVSWQDAVVWCNAYSEKTGRTPVYGVSGVAGGFVTAAELAETAVEKADADGYRLPSRQEWEFAARGGNPAAAGWLYTYAGSDDMAAVVWCEESCNGLSQPAGTKKANSLGLYDMSGNAGELCESDLYPAPAIVAGGIAYQRADKCTVDSCITFDRNLSETSTGFRLACSAVSR